jgi:hypothetical protein
MTNSSISKRLFLLVGWVTALTGSTFRLSLYLSTSPGYDQLGWAHLFLSTTGNGLERKDSSSDWQRF